MSLSRDQELIFKVYRVPYWVGSSEPKPSWLRRPVWRWRAWRWSRIPPSFSTEEMSAEAHQPQADDHVG